MFHTIRSNDHNTAKVPYPFNRPDYLQNLRRSFSAVARGANMSLFLIFIKLSTHSFPVA